MYNSKRLIEMHVNVDYTINIHFLYKFYMQCKQRITTPLECATKLGRKDCYQSYIVLFSLLSNLQRGIICLWSKLSIKKKIIPKLSCFNFTRSLTQCSVILSAIFWKPSSEVVGSRPPFVVFRAGVETGRAWRGIDESESTKTDNDNWKIETELSRWTFLTYIFKYIRNNDYK